MFPPALSNPFWFLEILFALTGGQYKRNIGQPNDSSKVGKAKPRASGGRKTAGLSKDPSQFRMKDSRVAANDRVRVIAVDLAFLLELKLTQEKGSQGKKGTNNPTFLLHTAS